MPVERFFLKQNFQSSGSCFLKDQEFHHLAHVMRMREGEKVELVNGEGSLALGTIRKIKKEEAEIDIQELSQEEARHKQLILVQGIPKPNRLEIILEKGTELGVDEFRLFSAKQSQKKEINDHQLDRYHLIIVSAMKQCGRLFLPKIVIHPNLQDCFDKETVAFFGDCSPDAPSFFQDLPLIQQADRIAFYNGPESGFSPSEIEFMKQSEIRGIKLNANILRTETAAIAASAFVAQVWA